MMLVSIFKIKGVKETKPENYVRTLGMVPDMFRTTKNSSEDLYVSKINTLSMKLWTGV